MAPFTCFLQISSPGASKTNFEGVAVRGVLSTQSLNPPSITFFKKGWKIDSYQPHLVCASTEIMLRLGISPPIPPFLGFTTRSDVPVLWYCGRHDLPEQVPWVTQWPTPLSRTCSPEDWWPINNLQRSFNKKLLIKRKKIQNYID